jgi:CRP-like cAMP-binding protein
MLEKLLPTFSADDMAVLKPLLIEKTAPRGAVLLEMGKEDRDLYLVVDGTCEVYQKFFIAGKLFALRVASIEAPLMLGETNMLLGEKRSAAVIVSTDVKYYVLPHKAVESLKTDHPHVAIRLLEHIASTVSRRFTLMQTNMRDKLLHSVDSPNMGLNYLRRYIGDVHVCSPALAKKLFNMDQPYYED